jgi:hypothetical protein
VALLKQLEREALIEPLKNMNTKIIINSWEDLQANVKKIISSLNKDEKLKFAAAANPILALEELGYEIAPGIRGFVEDKIRFKTKDVAKLKKLRESIFKTAGREFDIRSGSELNTVLFDELGLAAFDEKGCHLYHFVSGRKKKESPDDLEFYKELHPIIKPLLEFRILDASVAGFCSRDTYQKIRSGQFSINSDIKLNIRLKKEAHR